MKPRLLFVALPLAATLLGALPVQAGLTHRYSFTTDANDSVGLAHGALMGNAMILDGAVVLDGTPDTYVDLPGGLITGYTALTFEAWASFGVNGNWSRLYDFGDTNPNGAGRWYVMFSPHSGPGDARVSIADADPGYNNEFVTVRPGVLDDLGVLHIAAVYAPATSTLAMYLDGVRVSSRTDVPSQLTSISNVFSYLGRSLYAPDAWMNGSILEFRIHDEALSAPQIAASFAAGPETPRTDPGALQAVTLSLDATTLLLNGLGQATLFGQYAAATNVNLSGLGGVTFASSATNVVTVDAAGQLRAVGLGTASVTGSYQGKQDTQTVKVVQAPAVLVHRYSFDEAAGASVAKDSVGNADGTLVDLASFTGTGSVELSGGAVGTGAGYVDLPNGIISRRTNATFEAWTTWTGNAMWERLWDFGSNSAGEDQQGTGTRYLFLSPRGGANRTRFSITSSGGGAGEQMVDGPALFPANRETHVVVTYNYSQRTASLYLNGLRVASGTVSIPLAAIADVNNWIGRSNWPDPFYGGRVNEFRIYEGALTDAEVALSAAVGPDKLASGSAGDLRGLTLQVPATLLVGALTNATVFADFASVSNLNVTALPGTIYTSSAPGVVTVSTNGVVEAVGPGTATVTAAYQSKSSGATVVVTQASGVPAKPVLVHRYSFDEAAGSTTVRDRVGTAHGTLKGSGGVFNGTGKLTLPGGAANSSAAYVDLPNGMISGELTNATFEAWVTWKGTSGTTWQRLFDFGSNVNGEDQQGTGTTYLFLTPRGGASRARFGITITGGGAGEQLVDSTALLPFNQPVHVALSYAYTAGIARLYVNGVRVGTGPVSIALQEIEDVNNWLGRSNWPDAFFNGDYDEFRIYNGARFDADVAASFAAGPDALPGEGPVSLTVARVATQVILSWPASATGFVLESTAQLGSAATWQPTGLTPVVEGGTHKVSVTLDATARFYRLKR